MSEVILVKWLQLGLKPKLLGSGVTELNCLADTRNSDNSHVTFALFCRCFIPLLEGTVPRISL